MRSHKINPNIGVESLNIIITGKSGAGKSSFLNYLIDKDHFVTGVGEPVTQEYFEDFVYTVPDTGVKYHLFDTKGIEPTNLTECSNIIIDEIKKRDKNKTDIFSWIHTVYYCFAASSKRIEQFELDFINRLNKYVSIVVLLTKKDLVTEAELDNLTKQIENGLDSNAQIIPVCSVESRTRRGCFHREGREDVLRVSFFGLWSKLSKILPRKTFEGIFDDRELVRTFKEMKVLKISPFIYFKTDYKIEIDGIQFPIIDKYKGYSSLDLLVDFPVLPLGMGKDFLEMTEKYIKRFLDSFKIDVEDLWKENTRIHQRIFAFYKRVNKTRPRILYSDLSKDSLKFVARFKKDSENILESLRKKRVEFEDNLSDYNSAWFFDNKEKLETYLSYYEYRDIVIKFAFDLNSRIKNYISTYEAELMQYGNYCLRKDNKADTSAPISSEADLDREEKILSDVIRELMSDDSLSDRERKVIDVLSEVLDISPSRKTSIESFLRTYYFE